MNTLERWLNTIGLVAGIIGVVIIFQFGPPQPNLEPGSALLLEGDAVTQQEADKAVERKRYEQMSELGLLLVAIGFVFQLVAVWIPVVSIRRQRAGRDAMDRTVAQAPTKVKVKRGAKVKPLTPRPRTGDGRPRAKATTRANLQHSEK